jgi:DNA-binding beta-propeller fold protein YncE
MWIINGGDGTLTIVDRESLKVDFTVNLGVANPSDAVWLPAGFDDLASARLAIITRRSGHIVLVDPEAARGGAEPVVQRLQLGGVLSRIVADPATGTIYAADAKNRRVYALQASELAAGDADVESYALDFAARDIVAAGGRLYAATGAALVWFEGDEAETNRFVNAQGVGIVPASIISGGAIAVVTENRVENYSRDGVTRIVEAEGNRVRRVITFVSPE